MMLSAAATRRTSCALTRNLRTPTTPTTISRKIAFASQPRPLRRLPVSKTPNGYSTPQPLLSLPYRHALSPSIQTRSLSYLQRTRLGLRHASKGIWRKNPILFPLAIISVIGASLFFAYLAYIEVTQNAPQYHKFPPKVAKPLRQAIYYTDVVLDPRLAMKHYKEALRIALASGMHPYSDELVGIQLKVADMLEQAGQVDEAIKQLELTRKNLINWVEKTRKEAAARKEILDKHDKKVEEQAAQKQKKIDAGNPPVHTTFEVNDPQILDDYERLLEQEAWVVRQQDKAMKKAVGISIRLGELFASDYIQDVKRAEAAHEKAVELGLAELAYREGSGLPTGGGLDGDPDEAEDRLTNSEVAVALLGLGQIYMNSGHASLTLPVYNHALKMCLMEEREHPTCLQIHVMTNIAATLGMRAMLPFPDEKNPEASRREVLESAKKWALETLNEYEKIPESERQEGCSISYLYLAHSLGEFAEHLGDMPDAKKWHKEALDVGKKFYEDTKTDPEVSALYQELQKAWERVSKD
ncbi:hypothetical protein BDV18DRAFT_129186 [Aspergillus unguis]